MADNKWDPIDPSDELDLWVNFASLIPAGSVITTHTVEVPEGVTSVISELDGTLIRWRTGPNELGKHLINFSVFTDADEKYNADVELLVKERIKK